MARRTFKRNTVKASMLGYYYYLRGVEKSGKTTLFYDLNETLFNSQDKGLLISMGKEDGYKALPDIQVEVVDDIAKLDPDTGKTKMLKTAWKQFVELVDDLVLDKMEKQTEIELIAIDTYDELCRLAAKEVVRQSNKENPTKQCKSMNAAFGGYNGGFERFELIVEEQLHRLRKVGYTLFVISHTKVRTIKEKGASEEETYQMLTTNLDSRLDDVITHKADVIATIQIDKDIENGKLTGTKRYIYFRESNFVKAGSRFKEIIEKVELSAPNFIKAVEDGIKASLRKQISDEEFQRQKIEDEKKRSLEIEESQNVEVEIDVARNTELKELIVSKLSEITPEQKEKLKEIMNTYGMTKLSNVEENKTQGMEEIFNLF